MEKIIKLLPAFDKRHKDPNKNYGVGGVKVMMILKGEEGAVHFIFNTGMMLPSVYKWWNERGLGRYDGDHLPYMGYDVGYHSHAPLYEEQGISQDNCEWIGGPCYSDGSALAAEEYMNVLIEKGSDAIWEMLEERYKGQFKS